jgi:Fic family protein
VDTRLRPPNRKIYKHDGRKYYMAYTEIKEINGRKYYYRVKSIKKGKKTDKKRVYLGVNLNGSELKEKIKQADNELNLFTTLLNQEQLKILEKIKKEFSKEPKENYENRYEAFCSLFTYDSTNIEGNTLTLNETSHLLFEGIVPSTKSLREINEVLNHKKAFDYILNYKKDITKEFILSLHYLVVVNTLREDLAKYSGKYRKVQVFIGGTMPPPASEVPNLIASLLRWYSTNKKKLPPLVLATYFHNEFERIHPFVDGNGRVGRLLMNFILHKNKLPMVNIPNKRKFEYYEALRKAHQGNHKPFISFLIDLLKKEGLRF